MYLILGAGGGLGRTFKNKLGSQAVALQRAECDVTDRTSIARALKEFKPKYLINTSGYTAVDRAEADRDNAFLVNATAIEHMAKECESMGVSLITFSTDYVFAGDGSSALSETDSANPKSVYGLSKLEGEKRALRYERSLVIRTSWLYSETGKSFPRTILSKAIKGEALKIVDDQVSSPTFSIDLVQATLAMASKGLTGLYHYSCEGQTNWNSFAAEAIRRYGELSGREFPMPLAIPTSSLNLAAPRPGFSVLSNEKALGKGISRRSWQKALSDFVERISKEGTL